MIRNTPTLLLSAIPWAFVVIWSTGFIAAKLSLQFAAPILVLFVRMFLVMLTFAAILSWRRPQWCTPRQSAHQMVVGVLIHASFLFGVFSAIEQNLPAGVVSLVMGLQPILTAVLAFLWLNASIKATQWLGLFLGLAGVALVVSTQGRDISQAIAVTGWLTVIFGLVAISVGTLYQKRFGGEIDPMVGAFFQYLAAAIVCGIGTVAIGDFDFQINATVIGAMLWMVFGLSVTAILLLMIMIRQNESTRVASYFYLTPPLTAIQAWALFGESLSFLAIIGFVVVLIGVFLTTRSQ